MHLRSQLLQYQYCHIPQIFASAMSLSTCSYLLLFHYQLPNVQCTSGQCYNFSGGTSPLSSSLK
uniref:Hydroxymethylglutaryl-CoA synthase n=1 Tax=Arundo donax TaxID=35708 RepID=A0A0A9ALA3_ARUDO